VVVSALGCSKSSGSGAAPDRCTGAFASASAIGAFGGKSYGGVVALSFGMSCEELTADELTCIQGAKSNDELQRCGDAADKIAASVRAISAGRTGGEAATSKDVVTLSDAVCACKDAGCIVGVGRKQRILLQRLVTMSMPTDDASKTALGRLATCLETAGAVVPARPAAAKAAATDAAAGSRCAEAGKRAPDLMGMTDASPELRDELAAQVEAVCREDGWAESTIACFVTDADMFKCVDAMPPEQRTGFGDLMSGRRHPKIAGQLTESKADVAAATVRKLANDAFPQWASRNMDQACPSSVDDLGVGTDPWGQPYRMRCGDGLPAGVSGVAIWSIGPDGVDGNADDVRSW
jgi:hypothetical protein